MASGGTRVGLLKLADEVLAAFDVLVELARNDDGDPSGKLAALRKSAESNPLLSDVLATLDNMHRSGTAFASDSRNSGCGWKLDPWFDFEAEKKLRKLAAP